MAGKSKAQMQELEPKMLMVIDEFFANGFNRRDAMTHAGYAPSYARTKNYKVFNHPAVRKEINRRKAIRLENFELNEVHLLERMFSVAMVSLGEVIEKLQANEWDVGCLSDIEKYALGKFSVKETEVGHGNNKNLVREVRVETKDILRALETLFKHKGMLTDKLEVTAAGDLQEAVAAARRRTTSRDVKEGE